MKLPFVDTEKLYRALFKLDSWKSFLPDTYFANTRFFGNLINTSSKMAYEKHLMDVVETLSDLK